MKQDLLNVQLQTVEEPDNQQNNSRSFDDLALYCLITSLSTMGDSKTVDAAHLAGLLGYTIPESQLSDYSTMLNKAISAFELVESMDGASTSFIHRRALLTNIQTTNPNPTSQPAQEQISTSPHAPRIPSEPGPTAANALPQPQPPLSSRAKPSV